MLAMNQDRDVIDDACDTVSSGVLEEGAAIGENYNKILKVLREKYTSNYQIDSDDMELLNGLVVQSGTQRKKSKNQVHVDRQDNKD